MRWGAGMPNITYHPRINPIPSRSSTICVGLTPWNRARSILVTVLYGGRFSLGDGKQLRSPPKEAHFGHLPSCVFAVADTHSGLAPGAGLLPDWSRNAPNCPDLVKGRANVVQTSRGKGQSGESCYPLQGPCQRVVRLCDKDRVWATRLPVCREPLDHLHTFSRSPAVNCSAFFLGVFFFFFLIAASECLSLLQQQIICCTRSLSPSRLHTPQW